MILVVVSTQTYALAATITTIVVVSRIQPCIENYNSGSAEQKTCINQRLHI